MTNYLVVKVINANTQKVMFERVLNCPLDDVRFATIIDAFSILYKTIPHKVVFDFSIID